MRKMARMIITAVIILLVYNTVNAGKTRFHLPKVIRDKFRKLQVLVKRNGEPRGEPFTPLIAKPHPSQRVVIVGAGLAGLHMSYLLKERGFNKVVILEKESRIGGKVMSVWHDECPHELGAVYTGSHYQNSIYALAKELGVDEFVPRPQNVGVWLDHLPVPLPFSQYIIDTIKKFTNASNTFEAVEELLDAAVRYSVLHRRLFGKYEGELMQKPCIRVLSHLNQTFMSYLTEHRLLALSPILIATHTIQGYDHLDEISALYGLLWNTPDFLQGMIALGLGMGGRSNSDMFRYGFQKLTDKLAVYADIRLNVNIENIQRGCGGITIRYTDDQVNYAKTEKFDFLIWAADPREALQVLSQTSILEDEFSHLRNTWFTATLFESKERCLASPPIEYWMGNVVNKREHSVWARRNSKLAVNGGDWPTTEALKTPISFISYQMGSYAPVETSLINAKFTKHFQERHGLDDINVIDRKTWNYFPRFSTNKIAEGILWEILEYQGDMNTWYIGSSVIFESARSVVEYNQLMMRRMDL